MGGGPGGMGPPTTADFVPVTPGAVPALSRRVAVARSGKGSVILTVRAHSALNSGVLGASTPVRLAQL